MVIDAHTHLFSPDHARYPYTRDPIINMYGPDWDGSAEALKAQMDANGVERAVTISPWSYHWDMTYVLDALEQHRSWLAVAVLVDPYSPDSPKRLERYVKDHGVSGLRIHGRMNDLGHYDDSSMTALWKKIADLGIPLDACAALDEYEQLEKRAREFHDVPILLDHCGYVFSSVAPKEPTLGPVLKMSRYHNVYAKLTFLEAASHQEYPFADVQWMVREIINAYGAERCMFGTNWTGQPNTKMNYQQSVALFAQDLELTAEERQWIMGGTAATLWKWG